MKPPCSCSSWDRPLVCQAELASFRQIVGSSWGRPPGLQPDPPVGFGRASGPPAIPIQTQRKTASSAELASFGQTLRSQSTRSPACRNPQKNQPLPNFGFVSSKPPNAIQLASFRQKASPHHVLVQVLDHVAAFIHPGHLNGREFHHLGVGSAVIEGGEQPVSAGRESGETVAAVDIGAERYVE